MTDADNTTPSPTPTRGSTVTLREINKENWRVVTELSVAESQSAILTSNLESLCESHYAEDAWARAVYADETLVGFMMLSIWPVEDWYAIWRFMIDQKFQSLGFGRKAILLAINHITTHYPEAKQIRLMTAGPEGKKDVVAKDSPYKFYAGLGWKDISDYDEDGEVEMGLDLQQ